MRANGPPRGRGRRRSRRGNAPRGRTPRRSSTAPPRPRSGRGASATRPSGPRTRPSRARGWRSGRCRTPWTSRSGPRRRRPSSGLSWKTRAPSSPRFAPPPGVPPVSPRRRLRLATDTARDTPDRLDTPDPTRPPRWRWRGTNSSPKCRPSLGSSRRPRRRLMCSAASGTKPPRGRTKPSGRGTWPSRRSSRSRPSSSRRGSRRDARLRMPVTSPRGSPVSARGSPPRRPARRRRSGSSRPRSPRSPTPLHRSENTGRTRGMRGPTVRRPSTRPSPPCVATRTRGSPPRRRRPRRLRLRSRLSGWSGGAPRMRFGPRFEPWTRRRTGSWRRSTPRRVNWSGSTRSSTRRRRGRGPRRRGRGRRWRASRRRRRRRTGSWRC
mmetsp:Transcript_7997/g.32887  ORF Transcript_7997/g.32887 Transcript_7997/m.32887 type:complete len:380 (+) Transcript_7997:418-1557(+)